MADPKSLFSMMPVAVALIGVVGVILVQQEKNAQALREAQLESAIAAAEAERELRVLEIFSDLITSPDEAQRARGLQMLRALDVDLARRLARAVSEGPAEESEPRSAAGPSVEDTTAIADPAAVDTGAPLIYVHVQQEEDLPAAQTIAGHLIAYGFDVPEIERLDDRGPPSSQLRFFSEDEEAEAQEISRILEGIGIGVTLTYIAGYEESRWNRPRHYEIWLAPGTPGVG